MIDLHTHTLLSDGVLVPAEHIRRAEVAGYRVLGFSDHADLATMATIVPIVREAAARENALGRMEISGKRGHCLTNGHVARVAREAGAKLIFGSDAW